MLGLLYDVLGGSINCIEQVFSQYLNLLSEVHECLIDHRQYFALQYNLGSMIAMEKLKITYFYIF